jgi:hypothetical protein
MHWRPSRADGFDGQHRIRQRAAAMLVSAQDMRSKFDEFLASRAMSANERAALTPEQKSSHRLHPEMAAAAFTAMA